MLAGRTLDGLFDRQPVTHHRDVAEGHAGLRHPEGAGIHADEKNLGSSSRVALDVALEALACVDERVVDVGDRQLEGQLVER